MSPELRELPSLLDISAHTQAMPERRSFLEARGSGLTPAFAKELNKLILLMEWPITLRETKNWLRCYAAILPHGQVHVAETFFCKSAGDEAHGGAYLGSHKTFSIKYPNGAYDPSLDDFIAEKLARTLGFEVENE